MVSSAVEVHGRAKQGAALRAGMGLAPSSRKSACVLITTSAERSSSGVMYGSRSSGHAPMGRVSGAV